MFKILIDICINLVIRSETLGETTSFCILSQIFFHFKWIHFPIYFVAFKHWTLDVYCSTELPSFFKINYIRFFMLMVFVKLKQLWATEKSTVVEHRKGSEIADNLITQPSFTLPLCIYMAVQPAVYVGIHVNRHAKIQL